MVKILVCFNFIPDLDVLNEDDWKYFDNINKLDFSGVNRIIEPQDESALELSLRNKKKSDHVFLAAVIAASEEGDIPLKTLLALGYDKVYRIEDMDIKVDVLKKIICENNGFDLLVTGAYSSIIGYRHFPIVLSENINTPIYTNVVDFQIKSNEIKLTRKNDTNTISQTIDFPAILTVGDVASCFLHVPTLMQRAKTKDKDIEIVTCSDNSSDQTIDINNFFNEGSLIYEDKSRKGKEIIGENSYEIAKILYDEFIKEVLL